MKCSIKHTVSFLGFEVRNQQSHSFLHWTEVLRTLELAKLHTWQMRGEQRAIHRNTQELWSYSRSHHRHHFNAVAETTASSLFPKACHWNIFPRKWTLGTHVWQCKLVAWGSFLKSVKWLSMSPDIAFSAAPTFRPYKANIKYALLKTVQENPDTAGGSDCLYYCNGLVERNVPYGTADPSSRVLHKQTLSIPRRLQPK